MPAAPVRQPTVSNVQARGVTLFAWPYSSPRPGGASNRYSQIIAAGPQPVVRPVFNSIYSPYYAVDHPADYGSRSVVYDPATSSYQVLNPVTGRYSGPFYRR
jgi:hypothetical protein